MRAFLWSIINFLFIALIGPSLSWADAGFCTPNTDGSSSINYDYLAPSDELLKLAQTIQSKNLFLANQLNFIKTETFVLTTPINSNHLDINGLEKEMVPFRQQILDFISQAPAHRRTVAVDMISNYFKLAANIVKIKIYNNPFAAKLNTAGASYNLQLSEDQLSQVFPYGVNMIDGLDVKLVNSPSSHFYRLSLSLETIYHYMVEAAASSPITQQKNMAYFQTVHCTLGRSLLGKFYQNNLLINNSDPALSVRGDTPLCLGSNVSDFLALTAEDSRQTQELTMRQELKSFLPTVDFSAKEFAPYIDKIQSAQQSIAEIYVLPDTDQRTFAAFNKETSAQIDKAFAAYPALQGLRHVLTRPQIFAKIQNFIKDCRYNLTGESALTPMTTDQLIEVLSRADDLFFLTQLPEALNSVILQISPMRPNEAEVFFNSYIRNVRLFSAFAALQFYFKENAGPQTPSAAELDALFDAILRADIESEIASHWPANDNLLIRNLVNKVSELSNQNSLLEDFRDQFANQMVDSAKSIEALKVMKEEDLPYNFIGILQSLSDRISDLSSDNRTLVEEFLSAQSNRANQLEAWQLLGAKLNDNVKKMGGSCEPISFLDQASSWLKSKVMTSPSASKQVVQNDCATMNTIAGALVLQSTQDKAAPTNMSKSVEFLRKNLSKRNFKTFITNYRNNLIDTILNNYHLLNFPTQRSVWNYMPAELKNILPSAPPLYTKILGANSAEDARKWIDPTVQISLEFLRKHLKTVLEAKNTNDLHYYINETNIINSLLGADIIDQHTSDFNANNVLSGQSVSDFISSQFVFSDLLQHHKQLQSDWRIKNGINREITDDFVFGNIKISIGFYLFGSGNWLLSKIPLGAATTTSSFINSFIVRPLNDFNSGFNTYLTGLLTVYTGNLLYNHRSLQSDLKGLNSMAYADALKPENFANSLPLISWSDFRRQETTYTALQKSILTNAAWDFGIVVLPTVFIYGSKTQLVGNFLRNRGVLESGVENMSATDLNRYIIKTRRQAYRMVNSNLSTDLRDMHIKLKNLNPNDVSSGILPDLNSLKAQRDRLLTNAKNPMAQMRIERAYEALVNSIPQYSLSLADQPNKLDALSKALFGSWADQQQIQDYAAEATALTGGTP